MKPFKRGESTIAIASAAILILAGAFVWWQTRSSGSSTPHPQTCVSSRPEFYYDAKLAFGFAVPQGYRLAIQLMQYLDEFSSSEAFWSATNTDSVVITASPA